MRVAGVAVTPDHALAVLRASAKFGKEAEMSVITISQATASGGRMLSEAVCGRLGHRYVGREEVIAKAARAGVSEEQLRTAMEKPPSFLGQSQHAKYVYLALVQAALTEEVRTDNVVYDGLAGHLLLGKGQHVLRVRIIAPMVFRIAMVELNRKISRKEATEFIRRTDEDRRKWTRFLHGVDWEDSSLYDAVINLEQMTLVDACDAICALAQSSCFQPTPETRADLDNLAVASAVKAKLAVHPATCDLQFEVAAKAGVVTIKGGIDHPEQIKVIGSVAREVPGAREVLMPEVTLATRI